MTSNNIYTDLIAHFGNQQKTADALNCTQPSVWKWSNGKAHMSAPMALKAEKITKGMFKAVDLCPALADIETVE